MAFQIKSPVGLAARLKANSASTIAEGSELSAPAVKPITYLAVSDPAIKDRLGIVFDDSGSMCGSLIQEAKDGVVDFLRNLVPNQTASAVYGMNGIRFKLETNIPYIAGKIYEFEAEGSTPLVSTTIQMLRDNSLLSRLIVFSDGQPDRHETAELVAMCKERKVPIDTVYIGADYDSAIGFMRRLAEDTGGTFIHLKPGVSMRSTFKYLAPAYRALLADKSFIENLQNGRV